MISEEHKEYYRLVDGSILRAINDTCRTRLKPKDYHGFFEPDAKNIKESDNEEQQFRVDAANLIENAFHLNVSPAKIGEVLAEVLLHRGWCE